MCASRFLFISDNARVQLSFSVLYLFSGSIKPSPAIATTPSLLDEYLQYMDTLEETVAEPPHEEESEFQDKPSIPAEPPFICYLENVPLSASFFEVNQLLAEYSVIGFSMPTEEDPFASLTFKQRDDLVHILGRTDLALHNTTIVASLEKVSANIEVAEENTADNESETKELANEEESDSTKPNGLAEPDSLPEVLLSPTNVKTEDLEVLPNSEMKQIIDVDNKPLMTSDAVDGSSQPNVLSEPDFSPVNVFPSTNGKPEDLENISSSGIKNINNVPTIDDNNMSIPPPDPIKSSLTVFQSISDSEISFYPPFVGFVYGYPADLPDHRLVNSIPPNVNIVKLDTIANALCKYVKIEFAKRSDLAEMIGFCQSGKTDLNISLNEVTSLKQPSAVLTNVKLPSKAMLVKPPAAQAQDVQRQPPTQVVQRQSQTQVVQGQPEESLKTITVSVVDVNQCVPYEAQRPNPRLRRNSVGSNASKQSFNVYRHTVKYVPPHFRKQQNNQNNRHQQNNHLPQSKLNHNKQPQPQQTNNHVATTYVEDFKRPIANAMVKQNLVNG